jgi:hypothetical protein
LIGGREGGDAFGGERGAGGIGADHGPEDGGRDGCKQDGDQTKRKEFHADGRDMTQDEPVMLRGFE